MKKIFILGVGFYFFLTQCYAISERNYHQDFTERVQPYFDSAEEQSFRGVEGIKIPYRVFKGDQEKGALVIVPGRSEPVRKYAEVVYDLKDLDFSIYLVGHRGQGESELIEGCPIQYVEDFNHYVSDFAQFMEKVVEHKHSKNFLMAHSMGAAVGALYQARYNRLSQYPLFDGMIFLSPMFDVNTSPYPKFFAPTLANLVVSFGLGKSACAGDCLPVSSSPARKEMAERMFRRHSVINPEQVSYAWAQRAMQGIQWVHEWRTELSFTPILVLQAGNDLHVPKEGQNEFCEALPLCKKVEIPGAYHNLLAEADPIRDQVLEEISAFLRLIESHRDFRIGFTFP